MKLYTYLALATLFLASCTSNRMTSSSYDDVYYTPEDDIIIVQKAPQPAPEKYTPQEPVRLSNDREAIPTEDYADVDADETDYERRIRRFRGEEFEYSYENGYAQGYQDANQDNQWSNNRNNGWNNGWYEANNWGNSQWNGNNDCVRR